MALFHWTLQRRILCCVIYLIGFSWHGTIEANDDVSSPRVQMDVADDGTCSYILKMPPCGKCNCEYDDSAVTNLQLRVSELEGKINQLLEGADYNAWESSQDEFEEYSHSFKDLSPTTKAAHHNISNGRKLPQTLRGTQSLDSGLTTHNEVDSDYTEFQTNSPTTLGVTSTQMSPTYIHNLNYSDEEGYKPSDTAVPIVHDQDVSTMASENDHESSTMAPSSDHEASTTEPNSDRETSTKASNKHQLQQNKSATPSTNVLQLTTTSTTVKLQKPSSTKLSKILGIPTNTNSGVDILSTINPVIESSSIYDDQVLSSINLTSTTIPMGNIETNNDADIYAPNGDHEEHPQHSKVVNSTLSSYAPNGDHTDDRQTLSFTSEPMISTEDIQHGSSSANHQVSEGKTNSHEDVKDSIGSSYAPNGDHEDKSLPANQTPKSEGTTHAQNHQGVEDSKDSPYAPNGDHEDGSLHEYKETSELGKIISNNSLETVVQKHKDGEKEDERSKVNDIDSTTGHPDPKSNQMFQDISTTEQPSLASTRRTTQNENTDSEASDSEGVPSKASDPEGVASNGDDQQPNQSDIASPTYTSGTDDSMTEEMSNGKVEQTAYQSSLREDPVSNDNSYAPNGDHEIKQLNKGDVTNSSSINKELVLDQVTPDHQDRMAGKLNNTSESPDSVVGLNSSASDHHEDHNHLEDSNSVSRQSGAQTTTPHIKHSGTEQVTVQDQVEGTTLNNQSQVDLSNNEYVNEEHEVEISDEINPTRGPFATKTIDENGTILRNHTEFASSEPKPTHVVDSTNNEHIGASSEGQEHDIRIDDKIEGNPVSLDLSEESGTKIKPTGESLENIESNNERQHNEQQNSGSDNLNSPIVDEDVHQPHNNEVNLFNGSDYFNSPTVSSERLEKVTDPMHLVLPKSSEVASNPTDTSREEFGNDNSQKTGYLDIQDPQKPLVDAEPTVIVNTRKETIEIQHSLQEGGVDHPRKEIVSNTGGDRFASGDTTQSIVKNNTVSTTSVSYRDNQESKSTDTLTSRETTVRQDVNVGNHDIEGMTPSSMEEVANVLITPTISEAIKDVENVTHRIGQMNEGNTLDVDRTSENDNIDFPENDQANQSKVVMKTESHLNSTTQTQHQQQGDTHGPEIHNSELNGNKHNPTHKPIPTDTDSNDPKMVEETQLSIATVQGNQSVDYGNEDDQHSNELISVTLSSAEPKKDYSTATTVSDEIQKTSEGRNVLDTPKTSVTLHVNKSMSTVDVIDEQHIQEAPEPTSDSEEVIPTRPTNYLSPNTTTSQQDLVEDKIPPTRLSSEHVVTDVDGGNVRTNYLSPNTTSQHDLVEGNVPPTKSSSEHVVKDVDGGNVADTDDTGGDHIDDNGVPVSQNSVGEQSLQQVISQVDLVGGEDHVIDWDVQSESSVPDYSESADYISTTRQTSTESSKTLRPLLDGEDPDMFSEEKIRWKLYKSNLNVKPNRPAPKAKAVNCMDGCTCLYEKGFKKTDVYSIPNPPKSGKRGRMFSVSCEMKKKKDGSAWTVIQRRVDGTTNFHRPWDRYAHGFGVPDANFWVGNNFLHALTRRFPYQLRVEFTDWKDKFGYAVYDRFEVLNEKHKYRLLLGNFIKGNRGDALSYHNNTAFSTTDRDNDLLPDRNCAEERQSGFWFKACNEANPNGRWIGTHKAMGLNGGVITWGTWPHHGFTYALKTFKMMIRPVPRHVP